MLLGGRSGSSEGAAEREAAALPGDGRGHHEAPRLLPELQRLVCAGRGCGPRALERAAEAPVAIAEWEVAGKLAAVSWPAHTVVLDPPFRPEYVSLLHAAAEAGSVVHLCYGSDERQETSRLLRYLVHPRFAMVCVYRALQEGEDPNGRLLPRAAEIAWREASVILAEADFQRAAGILVELGVGHPASLEAKLDARNIPAYAAGEAEYEECSALCLTL